METLKTYLLVRLWLLQIKLYQKHKTFFAEMNVHGQLLVQKVYG